MSIRRTSTLAHFSPSNIAAVAKGSCRVFLPMEGIGNSVSIQILLKRAYRPLCGDELLNCYILRFEGPQHGARIWIRLGALREQTLTLYCLDSKMVRKRFLRGDALRIELVSKPKDDKKETFRILKPTLA